MSSRNQFGSNPLVDANGYQLVNVAAGGAGGGAVTVADGADVTQGSIADAGVKDADGTVNAHLRGIIETLLAGISVTGSFSAAPTYSHTVSSGPTQKTIGAVTPVLLLAQNLSRTRFQVAQDGTTAIYILYGGTGPSNANYNRALPAGGTAHDGSSIVDDSQWQGSVYALSSAAGGSVLVTEFE